jgi:hypothetical protein
MADEFGVAPIMTEPLADSDHPIDPPVDPADASIFGPRRVTQAMVILTAVVSCLIFNAVAKAMHVPSEPKFRGVLLQPPGPQAGALVVGLLLLVACTGLGTLVLRRRWFLAGLMTAVAGLANWSVRGGPAEYVFFRADTFGQGKWVFIQMLGELTILFAVIGGLWNWLWARQQHLLLAMPEEKEKGTERGSVLTAILAQAAIMAVLLLLLSATSQKKQVLTSVFIAGLVATAIAESWFADVRAARWYWAAPLVVGVLGYAAGYFMPAGIEFGSVDPERNIFAPLTRVLPLDYASLGCAGVLLGYWAASPEPEDEGRSAE